MILKSKRKWFWVGMVLSIFVPPVVGLIFGISLFLEKPYRKEASIIIIWSIVWTVFLVLFVHYVLAPGLSAQGLPNPIPVPVQK